MGNENTIPGLTLWVEAADYKAATTFKAKGTIQLKVDIDDLEVWEEVIRRLDGMRVHAIDDFHRQLMVSLQQENQELHAQSNRLAEENRAIREEIGQSTSMTTVLVNSLKTRIGEQEQELQHYRNLTADTKKLLDMLVPQ
jgi:hypothetical protein